ARGIAEKNNLQDRLARTMADHLSNPNDGVRADAAAMLGVLGDKESWRGLANLLADSESSVRASAAQSLMMLQVKESGEAIVTAIQREKDRWTRVYLAGAAQKLSLTQAVEPLVGWLSDANDDVRKSAEGALKAITGENLGADPARWQEWLKNKSK